MNQNIKRLIKRILIPLAILSCIVPLIAMIFVPSLRSGPFGIGLPSDYIIFSSKYGFQVKLPKSWIADDATPRGNHFEGAIATAAVAGRGFPVLLISRKHQTDFNLEGVEKWLFTELKEENDIYNDTSFPSTKNDKFDGMIHEYLYDIPDLPFGVSIIKCQSWTFIENDNGWILSLCSRSNDWKLLDLVFEQVIQSFELTN